jgi:hypothetical protein
MARKFLYNKTLIDLFETETGEKALYEFSTSSTKPAYTRWLEKLVDVDKVKDNINKCKNCKGQQA